ncbi:hypothetical protein [Cupriavidus sp. BIS7]|uniref:hypothetical protein n=1 Tax=Cupriavidus sp. BIS7 TaxID=1217718 RepID=UPI0002FC51D9|nr:hypothetical protein [Cupriavidus sp. BIS7]
MLRWYLLAVATLIGLSISIGKRGILYDDDCWSPNHEYFMVRKQTLFSALFSRYGDEEGWILIYDKYSNFVHRWDGGLSGYGGPWWLGKKVVIMNEPQATLILPTDGGDGDLNRICY